MEIDTIANDAVPEIVDYGCHQSAEIGDLIAALAKAQQNFTDPKKDKQGQYGKHATMSGVYDSVRKHLNEQGIYLAVYKSADHALGTVGVCVRLHKGEQYIGAFATTPIKADRQSYIWAQASGWTYLERYLTSGLTGVAPDEDDDGATVAISEVDPKQVQQQHRKKPDNASPPVQPKTASSLFLGKATKEYGWGLSDIKAYLKRAYPESSSLGDLSEQQMNDALTFMSQNKPEAVLKTTDSETAA